MTSPPRRRWFAFSLRTLFVVVTVVACWLGYQLNWIRERDVFGRSLMDARIGFCWVSEIEPVTPPWSLRPFGENGVAGVLIENDPKHTTLAEEAARLFPEAKIELRDDWHR